MTIIAKPNHRKEEFKELLRKWLAILEDENTTIYHFSLEQTFEANSTYPASITLNFDPDVDFLRGLNSQKLEK